jgi:hypothetical protein
MRWGGIVESPFVLNLKYINAVKIDINVKIQENISMPNRLYV